MAWYMHNSLQLGDVLVAAQGDCKSFHSAGPNFVEDKTADRK